ncbi:esterase, partial [Streptomyces sp. NPDC001193]
MDVNGTVAEGFEAVRDAFVRNFEVLGDRGAAVAVYRDGRKVVAGGRNFPPEKVAEAILRAVVRNEAVVPVTPESKGA